MVSNFEYTKAIEMYKELAKREKCEKHNVVKDVEGDSDENGRVQYTDYCAPCYFAETLNGHLKALKDISHDEDQIDTIRVMKMIVGWLADWKQKDEVL